MPGRLRCSASAPTIPLNPFTENGPAYDPPVLFVEGNDTYAAVVFRGKDGYFYDIEVEGDSDAMYPFGVMPGTLGPIEG